MMKINEFTTGIPGCIIGLVLGLMTWTTPISAQNEILVKGVITDNAGEPLPGAAVLEVGNETNGVVADVDGNWTLSVPADAVLRVSYLGFDTQEVHVNGNRVLDIVLSGDSEMLDDVVVVGYGTQKKATVTGAVAGISNNRLVETVNDNVLNMMTGKIPGLRVVQRNAEPGNFDSSVNIRHFGDPLYIIDGVPRENFSRIDANDIESISVLKDASAAVYGIKAADGVILITTKKGSRERFSLQYDGHVTFNTMSGLPESMDAAEYMIFTNEKAMRSIDSPSRTYSDEQINPYLDGTLKSTDWYSLGVRSMYPSHQHSLSASGSTERVNYYTSLGYMNQSSFYVTNSLKYNRFNLRSNVDVQVFRDLKVSVSMYGMMDDKQQPFENPDWIIRALWRAKPMDPVYANDNTDYFYHLTTSDNYNPLAMMDRDLTGYKSYKNKIFESSATMEYKAPFLKGLSAKLMVSYDYNQKDNKSYEKKFNQYRYDELSGEYTAFIRHSPSKIRRETYYRDSFLWNVSLNFDRTFGKHSVNALLLYEESRKTGDNFYAQREVLMDLDQLFAGLSENQEGSMNQGDLFEYATRAVVGRVNYNYAGKYLVELSARYDMSSRFPTNKRGGFFPGGSIGWRISEEGFWKRSPLKFINNLKIRASYGAMGRDTNLDFQFLTGFEYPNGGYVFNGSYIPALSSKGLANPNITWEMCYTGNIGLDIEAWHGMLGFTFDAFQRRKEGIFGTLNQSLPGIVGENLPQENINSEKTTGLEFEIYHRHHAGNFHYSISGNFSFAHTINLYQERARSGNSYENWRDNGNNRYSEIWMGFGGDGQYQSWDEIWNSSVYVDNGTLPGDYRYEDWNGDGEINDLDKHPIAYRGLPKIYYGLDFSCSWKGLDFTMLWQGAACRYVQYGELLREPLWGGENGPDFFLDRWHPVDPNAYPYDPATEWVKGEYAYGGMISRGDSEFSVENASYLRLKNVEIGYSLPRKALNAMRIEGLRIYANVYNALTFSKLDYVDPEHVSDSNGLVYPVSRTFSVGVELKF